MKRLVALYLATGDDSGIVSLLRSDIPLNREDRDLLADWVAGKIKLGKGKPRLAYLFQPNRVSPLYAAAAEVERRIKADRRSKKTSHRELIDGVAKRWNVDVEALETLHRRSKAYKLKIGIISGKYPASC